MVATMVAGEADVRRTWVTGPMWSALPEQVRQEQQTATSGLGERGLIQPRLDTGARSDGVAKPLQDVPAVVDCPTNDPTVGCQHVTEHPAAVVNAWPVSGHPERTAGPDGARHRAGT